MIIIYYFTANLYNYIKFFLEIIHHRLLKKVAIHTQSFIDLNSPGRMTKLPLGRRDILLPARSAYFHIHSSYLLHLLLFVFHSEFHISHSHKEWNLLSSLRENSDKVRKQNAVKLNKLLILAAKFDLGKRNRVYSPSQFTR